MAAVVVEQIMSEPVKWWLNPQGIWAALAAAAMVLGFFYVREQRMWEQSARITTLETRGEGAITRMDTRFERFESALSSINDRVNFLERKIDRLELLQKQNE
jgi:flagellum-specific peptidoglycan hydrolase FlgJ